MSSMVSVKHPALLVPYDTLIDGLMAEHHAGNVSVREHGPLRLFTYTRQCAYDRQWNEWSLLARGLVLDVEARQVVATPFPKFFNYGEGMRPELGAAPLPDEPFEVTEKMDGSLGIVFRHGDRWRVATKGSFDSEQARWAEAWICPRLTGIPWRGTLLAEIVYPENRIVVPYDFAGMVALAAYDADGHELPYERLADLADRIGMPMIERHDGHTLDDLLALASTLPSSREGFVVRFSSGLRVKVKGDEYVRLHKLVEGVTPLAIFDMLVAGDDLNAAEARLPEEFRRDFAQIRLTLLRKFADKVTKVHEFCRSVEALSDKELGLKLKHDGDDDVTRWAFGYRKTRLSEVAVGGSTQRRRFMQSFRPTGNRLDGYVPSNAMNRFSEEAG